MKRDEKKEYQRPEITQHENLGRITKGGAGGAGSNPLPENNEVT